MFALLLEQTDWRQIALGVAILLLIQLSSILSRTIGTGRAGRTVSPTPFVADAFALIQSMGAKIQPEFS